MTIRETQAELLKTIQEDYPEPVYCPTREARYANIYAAALYLKGHGLVTVKEGKEEGTVVGITINLTSKGVDHMLEDGGIDEVKKELTRKKGSPASK